MAQLVLGVAGAVIGGTFGMPQIGWAIGSAIGSAFAPAQKSEGPRLGAEKVPAAEFGAPLPILEGHPRATFRVLWQGVRQEIKTTTSQGKGGGSESSSFTYKRDVLLHLSDAEILGIRRIWSNGGLIWSIADDSDEETIEASEETTRWDAMRVYSGAAGQLPDPAYEAVVGVGNAPAYRGRGTVFFEGLSLGSSGAMPILTFEVNALVTETAGATILIAADWAPVDRRHSPVLGAGVPGVKMTTIHKGLVKTWRTGPYDPAVAAPPEGAETRNPGMCNGDRAVMIFGEVGGTEIEIWAGFCIAGDGVNTTIKLPDAYKQERMGTDAVRASTWLGNIAVSSADPIADPGDWGNQGAIWLYTLDGDYLGRAFAGEPVTSLALTATAIYAACDSGVRVFDAATFAETEISPIAYPAGEGGYRIFVGGGGVLCCAVAESIFGYANTYTLDLESWVLDKSVGIDDLPVDVDFGTTEAHHFRSASKDVYTVVPKLITPPVRILEYFMWLFPHNISEGPVADNILDASAVDTYVFSRDFVDGNSLTEVSSPRYRQTGYEAYPEPVEIPVPNSVDADRVFVMGEGEVLADIYCRNVSGFYARQGAHDRPFFIKILDYLPEDKNAHDVYITPSSQSGTLIPANLKEVTERICYSTGLTPEDVDATELAEDWVYAFNIPPGAAKSAVDQLATGYYFECVESDRLYFPKRGRDPVLTIPYDDLGAEGLLTIQDANDLEVPGQVFVKYMNLDDAYQQGSEQSDRLTTDSTAISNIELALGFKPAQAKGIADTACLDQQIGSRTFSFTVDRRYIELEPTDVVLVEDGFGSTFRMRIAKISDAAGVRTIEAVADDASVLSATGITSNNYKPDYTVRPRALTDLVVLDMPILRDVDDGPGMYTAGDGLAGTWPGYALFIEGLQVATSTTGAAMGAATDLLGSWASGLADEVNSVTVQLNPGDQITSITHAQLTSTILNYCAIGAHGRWELLQYRSAELIGTGLYRLRGLLRGQLGTEHLTGTHAIGDRFVTLDGAGLLRPAASIADIETPRTYQGVTIDSLVSTAPVQTITNHGVGMRPYAPVNLRQSHSGTDIVLAWDRRTRYQTNLLTDVVPLGEAAEQYQVDVYDGPTVVRTLTTSTPTATYTEAQQLADFGSAQAAVSLRVYQISATVGRGTPLIYEA